MPAMHRFKDGELHKGNNMVMAIKSKFEHKENEEVAERRPVMKTPPSLSRQLSDPVKVKRTPAFRSDQKPFQRGQGNATSCRERKTVLKVSDRPSNVNLLRQQFDSKEEPSAHKKIASKALKERSNSSAEIILNKCSKQEDYVNIAALYTKPIPKNQRPSNAIHSMSTLKISEKSHKTDVQNDIHFKLEALTDTLRSALRKPLPSGPAPQKPPRTFMHQSSATTSPVPSQTTSPVMVNTKRKEFAAQLNVNLQKSLTLKQHQNIANNNHCSPKNQTMSNKTTTTKDRKPDPKYMLDKLENALKTNKIRKSQTADTKRLDNHNPQTSRSKLNLNCLHSLNCAHKDYERLPEYIKNSHDEPVYAEPFAFLKATYPESDVLRTDGKPNRSSLYYMSTPIASESTQLLGKQETGDDNRDGSRNWDPQHTDDDAVMCDTPSSSSRSSLDEPPLTIKDLIRSFEGTGTTTTSTSASSSPPSHQQQPRQEPPPPPATDRVDKLEKQLRRTLEASFDDAVTQSGASAHDKHRQDEAILGKFETYVRTIKMITQSRKKYQNRQMFHCCMLVILSDKVPYVKFKFPANAELPSSIEELVFPDSTCFDREPKAQCYSIVITTNDGQRIYGYCRRVLPEDSQQCLPLAYCILSRNRASGFFNRILEEIESRHGLPDKDRDVLLQEFYRKRFPNPGDAVIFKWRYTDENTPRHYALVNGNVSLKGSGSPERNGDEHVEIVLHIDARVNENDLEELCQCLDCANILLKVFASLLLERKVILLSRQLGRLSRCMEALQNILYPFTWPHTLIPVVPRDLWEIVEAPTPLICGVLSVNVVQEYEISDAIVVDLDNGKLLKEVGDEMRILPDCLVREFKDGLSLAKTSRNSPNKEKRSVYNVLLSDAFLRIFVHSCGHYNEYLSDDEFDLERYVKHPKKKSIRQFLKWFTQTSMFSTFVDNIVADKNCYKIFESRTRIYRASDATAILEKMKDWRRD